MLVPSFRKHPLSEDCQHFRTGFSRAFPALETPLNQEKCSMYPPKFGIISREMRVKKKNTPFLKKSPGEKSNTPLFLQFSGRTLSHEKYPFTGHFGNTHAVIPTSEWGGPGSRVALYPLSISLHRTFCRITRLHVVPRSTSGCLQTSNAIMWD